MGHRWGAVVAAAALSVVAVLISPQRDRVCPEKGRERGRVCPTRLGPGSGSPEGRPALPGSRPQTPQPVPSGPRPCLSADCRVEPVHLHEVLASVPSRPSVTSACACAADSPQPPPGLQASQHTLAFPWHPSPPPDLTVFLAFLVQNCLFPWLTSPLPPKTSTLSADILAPLLCHRPRPHSVLAQMLQNGQLPRRLSSLCPSSELGVGAARFTSSVCPGRRQL